MTRAVYSVQSIVEEMKNALHQYLEAQYHIWDESLIDERQQLFSEPGTTFRVPSLEATPFYASGKTYDEMKIPAEAALTLQRCAGFPGTGVFPRPFKHQGEAIENFVGNKRDIIVATGTGSGKTESFLLPLLVSFAVEAAERPESSQMHGCRAILIYPMNALVNDQLGRLRRLFGDEGVAKVLAELRGRNVRFGVYTSRTPYPGARSTKKDKLRLDPMFEKLYRDAREEIKARLREEGRWPAKDMQLFAKQGYITGPNDREMFTRHEMQATAPDILVTNYSMLEYMLIRPIERSIFDQTKEWLKKDKRNALIVVLDEAHMYRGAAGAEVALLLRRLQSRLEVDRTRLRYILTSASLGSDGETEVGIRKFAAELTGLPLDSRPFFLIKGQPDIPARGREGRKLEAEVLSNFDFTGIHAVHSNFAGAVHSVQTLLLALGLKTSDSTPTSTEELQHELFLMLTDFPPASLLAAEITGKPTPFTELSKLIFPDSDVSERALESLLALASFARRQEDKRVFLPVRLHLFFRGVSGIFSCINPHCSEKRLKDGTSLLGRMYAEPRLRCGCGGRVYEVLTHRDCGAAFIRGFMRGNDGDFLWHETDVVSERGARTLLESHLLVETQRLHPRAVGTAKVWIHIPTGRISRLDPNDAAFLPVYRPTAPIAIRGRQVLSYDGECPVCNRGWQSDNTKIMDLATKGDAPFAHLVKTQVKLQPPTRKESPQFPNGGRKSLLFSDGRQKAARLARDIPREIEQDVFRQALILAVNELQAVGKESRLDDQHIYAAFLHVLAKYNLRLFDGDDQADLLKHVLEYKKDYGSDLAEAINDHFSRKSPPRFNEQLLRQLGSSFYSLSALTLAVVAPNKRVRRHLQDTMKSFSISEEEIDAITMTWIGGFLDKMAFDEELQPGVRAMASGYWRSDWGILPGKPKKRLGRISNVYGRADEIEKVLLDALAGQRGAAFFIKPDKVILRLVTNEQWRQCARCTALSLLTFRGQCPSCQGSTLVLLNPETSNYLRARKTFWRDPVIKMLGGADKPFNVDVEEHTAQLSHRDYDDISSTTEEFERRFKDILLHDADTPIDVLSSTTTMEVGIDIGSLVAVGLRNIPPMRQNYQQRAGRAGRRGSSLSTVITYAQNSPHDHYYFTHPELVIAGNPPPPAIDVHNPRIIERHIHAAILQSFFHAKTRDLPPSSNPNLFTALGSTSDFYSSQSTFSLDALEQWITYDEEGIETLQRINAWIPHGTQFTAAEVGQRFIATLRLQKPRDLTRSPGATELLDYLFNKGLLPSYAFPRDLCTFQIEERLRSDNPNRTIKVIERPQQGLNIALSEYAPGRLVVVNKKTYRIAAVVADMQSTELDRAVPLFSAARKYVHCKDCLNIQGHSNTFVSGVPCPLCGGQNLSAIDVIQPEVVFPEGAREIYELDDDQVFTEVTSAQLPIPEGNEKFQWRRFEAMGQLVHAPNQTLIIVNKGEESELGHSGFAVCQRCGSASLPANAPSGPHDRHYLVDGMQKNPRQCNGSFQNVYLGYTFFSDILLLRVPFRAPLNLTPQNRYQRKPVEDALVSLSDAITLAACRFLDIDPRELGNGVRFVRSIDGIVADIFLFDTASGGAGYSNMAGEIFDKVFETARELLENCDCDSSCQKCLRHYGNRRSHVDLNRHLALDIWQYLMHGVVPRIASNEEQRKTLDPLIQMLELEGWRPVQLPDVPVVVERNGRQLILGSYPSILDPYAARHPLWGRALLFSQYEIERNLPGAFARVGSE